MQQQNLPWSDNPELYFHHDVLGVDKSLALSHTDSIADTTSLEWPSALGAFIAWVAIYFCVRHGVKSSGAVVYVTVPLPFIILFILFFRGITLEGAGEGIEFYLKPDFEHIFTHPKVWTSAATQIFFSLGLATG